MKLKTLKVQNFLSVRELTLDLQDRGLVLIRGKNYDNPDCDNNGSGKSTIIEALTYALYGRTIRGLKGDEVVHNLARKNTKVVLDLEDDNGNQYRVARYRKHQTNKNKSVIFRNNKDITPKSESDVNSFIADLLQADYLTFTSSILYTKESFRFVSATDAEMKQTFDLMLGLDVFTKCQEIAKNKLSDVEGKLSLASAQLSKMDSDQDRVNKEIQEAQEKDELFESSKQEELEDIIEKIERYRLMSQNAKKELKSKQGELSKMEKESSKLQSNIESDEELEKASMELKEEMLEAQSEYNDKELEVRSVARDIKKENSNISSLESQKSRILSKMEVQSRNKDQLSKTLGSPCPTCGKPLTEDCLESARAEYDNKLSELRDELDSLNVDLEESNKELKKMERQYSKESSKLHSLKEELDTLSNTYNQSRELLNNLDLPKKKLKELELSIRELSKEVSFIESSIESNNNRVEILEKSKTDLQKRVSPYAEYLNKYKNELDSINSKRAEVLRDRESLEEEAVCYEFWKRAYSNQGIKSYILDDITPFLNKRVNKYLAKLTSSRIEVKFTTQTTLKSGEKREKFSIEVLNADGGMEYIANSGGEKRRIDIAVNLALQDLVASRSTNRMNIAIFDEIFDALDATGVEKVIELLQEISSEKSTILVISHNEHLQSYFDNSITIVKRDGYSMIEDGVVEEDESDTE